MDEATGAALYDSYMARSHEALAIEVVTLRAWLGSLDSAMEQLTNHIQQISHEAGHTEIAMARCAGGVAAIHLLRDWSEESLGTINDFIVSMVTTD